jgi:PAS domain S-box-containing protein
MSAQIGAAVVPRPSAPPPRGWPGLFWGAFKRSETAMVLLDARRCHVEVNGAYLNLVGYRRNALIGHPVYEIVEGGPQLSEAEWQAALERREALGHIRLVCADGRSISVDYAAHPEIASGRRLVLLVAMHVDRRQRRHRPRGVAAPHDLTAREREIIELVARGESGPEIAAELHISYATVRTHVRNAQEKLGAQSRAQLVAMTLGEGHFAER